MTELYSSPTIVLNHGIKPEAKPGWRYAYIYLNSLTFGIANRRVWQFKLAYDPANNFNVQMPVKSVYRATPRSVLPNNVAWEMDDFYSKHKQVMATWPRGYTIADIEKYHPMLLQHSIDFYKLAWDTPAPSVSADSLYWIHPEEARCLENCEMAALAGVEDWRNAIPQPILDYLMEQVRYCEEGLWEEDDFDVTYDPESGPITEDRFGSAEKTFDLQYYYADFLPPCSRRD